MKNTIKCGSTNEWLDSHEKRRQDGNIFHFESIIFHLAVCGSCYICSAILIIVAATAAAVSAAVACFTFFSYGRAHTFNESDIN